MASLMATVGAFALDTGTLTLFVLGSHTDHSISHFLGTSGYRSLSLLNLHSQSIAEGHFLLLRADGRKR